MKETKPDIGMSAVQAKRVEYGIIGFCLVALIMIFQPFSQFLFAVGAVMVVIGGLVFNLIPQCKAGKPFKAVLRTGLIVIIVFAVVVVLALASAKLYGIYFVG